MADGTFLLKTKNLSVYLSSQIIQEVRYIHSSEERQQIMRACHVEPTSGHMGIKRTVHRVTEHFFLKGVTKDMEYMVRNCSVAALVSQFHYPFYLWVSVKANRSDARCCIYVVYIAMYTLAM